MNAILVWSMGLRLLWDNFWAGGGGTILPERYWVIMVAGAGAVDQVPWSVVLGGNPARVIKEIH